MKIFDTYKIVAKHIKQVAFQNAVTLVNTIFLAVTLLLLIFKEIHEALFLGVVLFLNIIIGIIQDLRAKVALEQLQILMTPKAIRITKDGKEETISLDQISRNDNLKISLGDQIPADGELTESRMLEVNEALLTGESENIHKKPHDKVLAGSIVTAGSAILRVSYKPADSFVAQMTEKIKQYTLNLSPIQRTLNTFIKYMTYLLLAIVIYVVIHGLTVHELLVSIVKDIAALTSTLVPQGLILATTVFFAYGAVRLFRKQVLLQEINATEKLGRIKNLCVDKTGTLTENKSTLECVEMYNGYSEDVAHQLVAGYMAANEDSSETTKAIQAGKPDAFTGTILDALPFSSSRKYGGATLNLGAETTTVVLGAPDILLPSLSTLAEHQWLNQRLNLYAPQAKRLVLLAQTAASPLFSILEQPTLHPVALFVLSSPLRPGTADIINFFQNRNIRIYVLSGDNPKTVQAIAKSAGIKHTDLIITGSEMEKWDEEEYEERVPAYHLFARIKPDQKEKIVGLLKTNGFTAMIGDGANDALAIKKADLGIAMFDGAGATRQIAQVVLMNNSFAALPVGISMSETIITNIELVASVFFNKVAVGLFLFSILAVLGHTYPLSPRNTTIINYFAIWLPMIYWAVFPAHKEGVTSDQPFLRKILPFSLISGVITSLATVAVFLLGPKRLQFVGSNIFVVIALIALGYWFFVLAPMAYGIKVDNKQKKFLYFLAGAGIAFLIFVMYNSDLSYFFDLQRPAFVPLLMALCVTFLTGWLQYRITKRWFFHKSA
jgi:cation-transporting P-type ATPase E